MRAHTAAAVSEELTVAVKEMVKASPGLSVKERLRSVARSLGMPIGRLADYWYGEIRCPPAHEADLIRAYHVAAKELIEARIAHEKSLGDFVRDHPRLAFLVPGPVQDAESPARTASFVAHKAKTRTRINTTTPAKAAR